MSAFWAAPSGGVGPAAALALAAALLGAREHVERAHELAGGRAEPQLAQGAGKRPAQLLEVVVGQVADRGFAAAPRRDRHGGVRPPRGGLDQVHWSPPGCFARRAPLARPPA